MLKIEHVDKGIVIRTHNDAVFIENRYKHALTTMIKSHLRMPRSRWSWLVGDTLCTEYNGGILVRQEEQLLVPDERLMELLI